MNNIEYLQNQYLPHNIAYELKNIGFNEPCMGFYDYPKNIIKVSLKYHGNLHDGYENEMKSITVTSPLYQQVFDWFEKTHKLFANINIKTYKTTSYNYSIIRLDDESSDSTNYVNDESYSSKIDAKKACIQTMIDIVQERFLSFLIGKTEKESINLCKNTVYNIRIVRKDKDYFILTRDLNFTRINIELDNDKITNSYFG